MLTRRDAAVATFVRTVPIFQDLKGRNLDILFDFLEERRWEVGDVICNEGELGRSLYVIREGEVEVVRRSSRGNNVPIVRLGPGECFGEMTLVELQPRSASVIVKKKAVTYSLTNLDLWNLYKADNFAYVIILQNITRMLSRRLRKADSRIVEFLELLEPQKKAPGAAKKPAKKGRKK
ncbi:MAG: cyclic nucleotide-binding domain-containing protein [Myxococcota bacterium]|jgi:CRP-like cAMP-binding protein